MLYICYILYILYILNFDNFYVGISVILTEIPTFVNKITIDLSFIYCLGILVILTKIPTNMIDILNILLY